MTKDWESVREKIRDLSVKQGKHLLEVKLIMERKHNFTASTRAYRMRLKDWGYMRYPLRGRRRKTNNEGEEESDGPEKTMDISGSPEQVVQEDEAMAQSDQTTPIDPNLSLLEEAAKILPTMDPWSQARTVTTESVMEMLSLILDGNSQELEQLILKNPNHVNYPIGLPFDAHGGRFFNHAAIQQCVILQHPDQMLLDIACALPSGPVVWVLIGHGAKGSRHPLGQDLAFHNAIKNGRTLTVQSLLHSGHSNVNDAPGNSWKPLLQAVFWSVPDVVRLLLQRGAQVNYAGPELVEGWPFNTALQLALERREKMATNVAVRSRCDNIVKMLLEAGADIHVIPAEGSGYYTLFELFLNPWQDNPLWAVKLTPIEVECLQLFIRKGADLLVPFRGFPCSAPSCLTFEHQVMWHSTPTVARLLIDNADPTTGSNGSNLLFEIVGSCPDAKRHPAETLRDIEVLLNRGFDPNGKCRGGCTPLRTCVERCPAVDVVPRLRVLLEGGADPTLRDDRGVQPTTLAIVIFEEPLKSQVMEVLMKKFHGRYLEQHHGVSIKWPDGYFPIADSPTFSQVMQYSGLNSSFETELRRMIAKDKREAIRKAAFSVASSNFLDSKIEKVKAAQGMRLTATEKVEIHQIITLRYAAGIADYVFDQNFVMSLLMPVSIASQQITENTVDTSTATPVAEVNNTTDATTPTILSHPHSLGLNLPTPLPMDTPKASGLARRTSISSTSSNSSASSFFVPSTTQIRWPEIGRATQLGDQRKADSRVLRFRCRSCKHEPLLTEAEYKRHKEEHWHAIQCTQEGCKRRFCDAERG